MQRVTEQPPFPNGTRKTSGARALRGGFVRRQNYRYPKEIGRSHFLVSGFAVTTGGETTDEEVAQL